MQPAQQCEVVKEKIDSMDVDQVIAANCQQCSRAPPDSGAGPSGACGAPRVRLRPILEGAMAPVGREQAKRGHLHRVPIVLQGNAQSLDDALQAALAGRNCRVSCRILMTTPPANETGAGAPSNRARGGGRGEEPVVPINPH